MPKPMIVVSTMFGAWEVQISNLLICLNLKKIQINRKFEKHWLNLLLNKKTCRIVLCGFMQNHVGPKKKHVTRKIEQSSVGDIKHIVWRPTME
jgi:hypothetical protein